MNYVVVTIKSWNFENFYKIKKTDKKNRWFLIDKKEDLTYQKIKKIQPQYIFFPHWSWFIPAKVYENFNCVVFHMTDLPYGRGGSPLQNLIIRGYKKTKISAIKVVKDLDAGPVYLKKELDLFGTAEEILKKASKISFEIMKEIIKKNIKPRPQKGEVIKFKRRKPEEGSISKLEDLRKIYDYVRMLDAEGYPRAFLETNKLKLEFTEAKLLKDSLEAKVKIIFKK